MNKSQQKMCAPKFLSSITALYVYFVYNNNEKQLNNTIIILLFPHTERTESITSYHASRLFNTTCHNTRIFLYKKRC